MLIVTYKYNSFLDPPLLNSVLVISEAVISDWYLQKGRVCNWYKYLHYSINNLNFTSKLYVRKPGLVIWMLLSHYNRLNIRFGLFKFCLWGSFILFTVLQSTDPLVDQPVSKFSNNYSLVVTKQCFQTRVVRLA